MRFFTMIIMLLTWTLSQRDNGNVDKNDDVDQDDNDKDNNDDDATDLYSVIEGRGEGCGLHKVSGATSCVHLKLCLCSHVFSVMLGVAKRFT